MTRADYENHLRTHQFTHVRLRWSPTVATLEGENGLEVFYVCRVHADCEQQGSFKHLVTDLQYFMGLGVLKEEALVLALGLRSAEVV